MAKRKYIRPVPKHDYNKIFKLSLFGICLASIIIAISIFFLIFEKPDTQKVHTNPQISLRRSSVVDMKHCEIPKFEIQDIKKIKLSRQPLPNCDPHQFMTSIVSTTSISDPLQLLIHSEHFEHYKVTSVECCYQNIFRVEGSDDKVSFSRNCTPFTNQHELDKKIAQLYVKCSSDGKEVFSNVHAIISRKKEFEDRQAEAKIDKKNAYKVVMIGFESLSRMNLQRGLPLIFNEINTTDRWFGMNGYTSISNDSFPNLFAILTGQSPDMEHRRCDPMSNGFLDNCNFIWKSFRNSGYVTLFAEDQESMAAFNRRHKGFKDPPTDHYFRPFVLAAEKKLQVIKKGLLAMCLGKSIYLDHIFIYLQKLMSIHEPDPFFGLVFINSISDKQLSSSPVMDKRISTQFLKTFLETSSNDTIFIIFSDSGKRFEDNESGFYEDRSPSLYIRLPPRFIIDNPSLVLNLKENSDKITSPYDLHITLRHILSLSTKKQTLLKAVGCSHCRSLFQEVPTCRRCQDAAVPVSSCPCSYQKLADVHDKKVVQFAVDFAMKVLNQKLSKMKAENGENCAKLQLSKITDAHEQMVTQFDVNYIIRFIVTPTKSHFEATVRRKLTTLISTTPQFELLGEIVHMNENTQPIVCVPASGKKFNRRFEDEVEDYVENESFWTSRSFPDY